MASGVTASATAAAVSVTAATAVDRPAGFGISDTACIVTASNTVAALDTAAAGSETSAAAAAAASPLTATQSPVVAAAVLSAANSGGSIPLGLASVADQRCAVLAASGDG